jgi:hypothetical protein
MYSLRLTPAVTRSPSAKTTDMQQERGDIPRAKRSRFQQHRQPEAHPQGAVASRQEGEGRGRAPSPPLLLAPPSAGHAAHTDRARRSFPASRSRPAPARGREERESREEEEEENGASSTWLANFLCTAAPPGTASRYSCMPTSSCLLLPHDLLLPRGLTASSPAADGAAGRWRSLHAALSLRSLLYAHQSIEEHQNALSQPSIPINLNMHVVLLQL